VTATSDKEPSGAQTMFGGFAPGLVHFTDDVLFGEAWKRSQLSPRDRSLITVAALTAGGNAEQLTFHLQYAKDNGDTEEELIEAITHLAFYVGDPGHRPRRGLVHRPPGPQRAVEHRAQPAQGPAERSLGWTCHMPDAQHHQRVRACHAMIAPGDARSPNYRSRCDASP
jgi:4-carboxymuconolactone decarboxylase